jgi:hypothetical protein
LPAARAFSRVREGVSVGARVVRAFVCAAVAVRERSRTRVSAAVAGVRTMREFVRVFVRR